MMVVVVMMTRMVGAGVLHGYAPVFAMLLVS